MGMIDRGLTGGYARASFISAITVGAGPAESVRLISPSGISGPLLQQKFVTARYGPAETWVPVGFTYTIPTAITVSAATVQLRKNGVAPTSGGLATLPFGGGITANEAFAAFTPWIFAAADLPGDAWSIIATVPATLGAILANLVYGIRDVIGVADGVAI